MGTKVYGTSDDLIEVDGDVRGEVGCYGTDDAEKGVLIHFEDGTILAVKYCGRVSGVWEVKALNKGPLFDRIDECNDSDADIYSDIAYLKDGAKRAYASTDWQMVA